MKGDYVGIFLNFDLVYKLFTYERDDKNFILESSNITF